MFDSVRVGTSQKIDIPENVNPNVSRNKPNTYVYVSWKLQFRWVDKLLFFYSTKLPPPPGPPASGATHFMS